MQLTTQLAVDAAKERRRLEAKSSESPEIDPDRDFLLYVEMDLKQELDRRDLISPVDIPAGRSLQSPDEISSEDVRAAFRRFGSELLEEFEAKTDLSLVCSGEVISSGPPYRFVNLWDIGTPNDVPKMMEVLGLTDQTSQLYGHLDYLVDKEVQDISRVFPFALNTASPPAPGKSLYYVMLAHQPPTVELYRFKVVFTAYREPMATAGTFQLVASTIGVTGVLNRIVQFWSLEVPSNTREEDLPQLVEAAFGKLPWRDAGDQRFNAEPAIILRPTAWDVSVQQEEASTRSKAPPEPSKPATTIAKPPPTKTWTTGEMG